MTEKIELKASMTVDEALQYADDQTDGATFTEGKRDLEMVLALLAFEVRRLRELKKPKYKLSDLLAEMDMDATMPEDLKAWMEMQPVGKERWEEFSAPSDVENRRRRIK